MIELEDGRKWGRMNWKQSLTNNRFDRLSDRSDALSIVEA
jgi:hypothetical protein